MPRDIRITALTAFGVHYALLRLPAVLRGPSGLREALEPRPRSFAFTRTGHNGFLTLHDYPSFSERGIVEGFYGTPWSQQDRLDILRFEGQHGMNAYYYAPKDDPYHRKLWRDPYPPEQVKKLGELVDAARQNFVDFCFAISPGLSMVYSSADDFSKLTEKLSSVHQLGVSCFALFLDDVPPDLESPQDQARFKTLGRAHVDLINRLFRYLKSQSADNRLTVTPTTYTNAWGSREYIKALGAGVDPHVTLVWTGPEVVSPRITVAAARDWGKLLRRQPLIWDNFPVNDGIPWRLNLGPLRGRAPSLPSAVRGLVANPMNQARASMISLQTVADYLWNSRAYDPARARHKAVVDQYGEDAPKLLAAFLTAYSDYWWQPNVFKPLFVEQRTEIDLPRIEQSLSSLESSIPKLAAQPEFQKLLPDLAPFPPQTRDRLAALSADPAFRHLPGPRLLWRDDYDVLRAYRLTQGPTLDGDFAKWQQGAVYDLREASQLIASADSWKGPDEFSARVALAWDEQYLYLGVDVTDPNLYQPFAGREIDQGDHVALDLETAFRRKFTQGRAGASEYHLLLSPGNFDGVQPSLFSDEDYLPPRPHPRDYHRDLKTAWKKTPAGYSGDIAIPARYFEGGRFREDYEIGLGFIVQKVLAAPSAPSDEEGLQRIQFSSKADKLFSLSFGNPASYQRLLLEGYRAPRAGSSTYDRILPDRIALLPSTDYWLLNY